MVCGEAWHALSLSCSLSLALALVLSLSLLLFSSHHQTLFQEPINLQISRRSSVTWHRAAEQH